jgi:hypothetical protein
MPDYLKVDRAICEVPLTGGAFEAPYILKLKGRYWLFVSGGGRPSAWNGSPIYVSTSEKLGGPWTPFKKVTCEPDSKDSFNAQTDFLFEVRGSAGSFILWGGDLWSQQTKTGICRILRDRSGSLDPAKRMRTPEINLAPAAALVPLLLETPEYRLHGNANQGGEAGSLPGHAGRGEAIWTGGRRST